MTARRVMIAATGSGDGKTTITCALLAALRSKGNDIVSFKCGPDYIDPMFHKKATGVESRNLDVYMMGEEGVKRCAARHSMGKGMAVYEGVMGLYDGLGSGSYASSNHISLLTNTPVILVLSATGAALSVCATIKGFLEFEKNNIRGVIFNNTSESMFRFYKKMIEERLNVSAIGYMPHIPEAEIESRHLGLVTAGEIADLKEKIGVIKDYALKCIDMDALLRIAGQAEPFEAAPDLLPPAVNAGRKPKIYVTNDEALSFRYEDNHDLLKAYGADLEFFSPVHDRELPRDADGIILWGGYPELYAKKLADNTVMKRSLRAAIDRGVPVYAECGGFMYMQQSMTDALGDKYDMLGVFPGNVVMTDKLQNFGYYRLDAQKDNMLCKACDGINAHFFHYSACDFEGDDFMAVKQNGKEFPCIFAEKNIFAGYQHLHFSGNPDFARNFVSACTACMKERETE